MLAAARSVRRGLALVDTSEIGLGRVSKDAVVQFTRQLGILLGAHVSVLRALHILSRQMDDVILRRTLGQVLYRVHSGNYLSVALAEHPTVFSPFVISMIRLGEATGNLAGVTQELSQYLERDLRMDRQARATLWYPGFVSLFSLATVLVLFRWIVPRLLEACVSLTADPARLPWPTQVLIHLVDATRDLRTVAPWLGAAFIGWHAAARFARTPAGQLAVSRMVLGLPIVGPLYRKLLLSHFCRALGTLLASGIRLQETFRILIASVSNRHFVATTVQPLVDDLLAGGILPDLLEYYRFPPLVCQLVRVGELSGTLPVRLQAASRLYDEEVAQALETCLQVLEPVLIGALGLLVGFLVAALFLPLYSVMSHI